MGAAFDYPSTDQAHLPATNLGMSLSAQAKVAADAEEKRKAAEAEQRQLAALKGRRGAKGKCRIKRLLQQNRHGAAVRKCPLLRRLWGLSGHRSASSIYEYTT
jgi:hypothetical protein